MAGKEMIVERLVRTTANELQTGDLLKNAFTPKCEHERTNPTCTVCVFRVLQAMARFLDKAGVRCDGVPVSCCVPQLGLFDFKVVEPPQDR